MVDFKTFAAQEVPPFEAYLVEQLEHIEEPTLQAAMTYSVMAGGKRLRPLLVFSILESAGLPINRAAYRVAGALELIHSYSLIHDDLPAMDNDDMRRGQPTNHKVFGEAQAILAGDGLLTLAFEWLTTTDLTAEQQRQAVQLLARAAGPNGMVAGQIEDIEGQTRQLSLPQLKQLHQLKTGCLIECAVGLGAMLAQLSVDQRASLRSFARYYGLAFQIQDDILDVTSTAEIMGKAVHKDAGEHKNTFPGLLGLSEAQTVLKETCQAARAALSHLTGLDQALLNSFLDYFKE
ncbi:polyprenyl synthetase family protein [Latilactobacillus graminis]|uniref:Farnesyl diphosphate synthase n=2 Tax=Latilactobacillus graminis TaxID=60519 RepID=A0AA89I3G0_9LACO|nr:farnesyl diphosphate synthase [Latilactobacillus graminis]KRM23963.1 farnesyl-diphosphate synthase [Latilactobacillus graminis DSM 20719]QFP79873.1 polyprenyl synthetase family protein [Latilactobacillus graminis]